MLLAVDFFAAGCSAAPKWLIGAVQVQRRSFLHTRAFWLHTPLAMCCAIVNVLQCYARCIFQREVIYTQLYIALGSIYDLASGGEARQRVAGRACAIALDVLR